LINELYQLSELKTNEECRWHIKLPLIVMQFK
jgi:hypothetical protein